MVNFEQLETQWRMPFCPQSPHWRLDWEGLLDSLECLKPLGGCQQDSVWHAEGDVLTHTKMVCEALVSSEAWRSLHPLERSIIFAAALFHDISKPETTRILDGRVRAPRHAPRGAAKTRQLLFQDILPTTCSDHFYVREQIADLVLHHGMPLHVIDQSQSLEVIRVSQYCRLDWLAMLAEADVRGRICEDQVEQLERIELFRGLCRSEKCYKQPRNFVCGHTRFKYLCGKWNDPDSPIYVNSTCEVILMSGLPGTGKDTWISSHTPRLPTVSLDKIRRQHKISPTANQGKVVSIGKEESLQYLRREQSFIFNATNLTRDMRQRWISLFTSYGATVTIQYIESSWLDLLNQNQSRQSVVPRSVIESLVQKFQPPKPIESPNIQYHIS